MVIIVITHLPSPYQVEFFNAISNRSEVDLSIIYLLNSSSERSWSASTVLHKSLVLDNDASAFAEAAKLVGQADLVVFNYYNDQQALCLMEDRATSRKPWVFWGERPGFRHPTLGKWARRWRLRWLHQSPIPIWGIGGFGVDGYQAEFGHAREYRNLPYFSDLGRFSNCSRSPRLPGAPRVILYSGSLIHRKGVDLLAQAFKVVAQEFPNVVLRVMGNGVLRSEMERVLRPISSQVEFLGFKDWQELPEVYAAADVLCVPSRHDGWGLVVPEGLASGIPVIATNRMGAAIDLIVSGENGWLIEAGNLGGLVPALREAACLSPEELQRMSGNARLVAENHSLDQGVTRFLSGSYEAAAKWGH